MSVTHSYGGDGVPVAHRLCPVWLITKITVHKSVTDMNIKQLVDMYPTFSDDTHPLPPHVNHIWCLYIPHMHVTAAWRFDWNNASPAHSVELAKPFIYFGVTYCPCSNMQTQTRFGVVSDSSRSTDTRLVLRTVCCCWALMRWHTTSDN